MHSIIQIENGTYKINRAKFSTFPALIASSMRKSEDDAYHLTGELQNPKIDKVSEVSDSHRDQPESLSWYHGTIGNQVYNFCSFCNQSLFMSLKRTNELLSREPTGKYFLRKNDQGLFRLSYKTEQRKVFLKI